MSGHVRTTDIAGITWIPDYPDNPTLGLSYVKWLIVLNDAAPGLRVAVLDGALLTRIERPA